MMRFLAIIRRVTLAGIVSLILGLFVCGKQIPEMFEMAKNPTAFKNIFCFYVLVSPCLYVIFNLISSAYIRRFGQFSEIHREKSFVSTVFRAFGSDLISPFKNLGGFVTALFNRYPDAVPDEIAKKSRGVSIRRFFGMIILILFCAAGLGSLL